MRIATPFLDVGELESKWYFQNMATRSYSLIWCVPVGLNSCRLRVCGASVNPFKRWHSRWGVISGPPTLRDACDRVCPVGAALQVVSCASGGGVQVAVRGGGFRGFMLGFFDGFRWQGSCRGMMSLALLGRPAILTHDVSEGSGCECRECEEREHWEV